MTRRREKPAALLPARVRVEMVVRSLFIQATNNFERMMSLGFLFALAPALRRAYPDAGSRRAAAERHLRFFNTQPYLANSIVGVVAHQELTARGPGLEADVTNVKRAMMGAFGALGDDLFWAGLMPAAATLALVVFAVAPAYAGVGALAAFAVYNVAHLWTRIRLFDLSLAYGRKVTWVFRKLRLPRAVLVVKAAAGFLVGVLAVALAARAWSAGEPFGGLLAVFGLAAAFALALALQLFRVKPGWCWLIVAAAAFGVGVLRI